MNGLPYKAYFTIGLELIVFNNYLRLSYLNFSKSWSGDSYNIDGNIYSLDFDSMKLKLLFIFIIPEK